MHGPSLSVTLNTSLLHSPHKEFPLVAFIVIINNVAVAEYGHVYIVNTIINTVQTFHIGGGQDPGPRC